MEYQRLRETLINLVRKNRCIYDKNCREYTSQQLREDAWKKISEETRLPVQDAKIAWRTLRERYTREIKKMREGVAESEGSLWPFYKQMAFLESHIKPRNRSFVFKHRSPSSENDHTYQSFQDTSQAAPDDALDEEAEYLKDPMTMDSDLSDDIEEGKVLVQNTKALVTSKSPEGETYQLDLHNSPPPKRRLIRLRTPPPTPHQATEQSPARQDVLYNYMRILEEKFRQLPQPRAENIILKLIAELNTEIASK